MSPLAAALALLLAASPFRAEQPSVREGNEKLGAGDPAGALERYRRAEEEVGAHPEIEFDRGDALYAQGKHEEAREAWRKAAEADRAGALASRALQNSGNALDAAGDRAGAERAFSEALRRDPGNEDARYNLEVLLRRKAASPPPRPDEQKDQQKDQPQDQNKDRNRDRQQGQQPQEEQPGQPQAKDQGGAKDQAKDQAKAPPDAPPRRAEAAPGEPERAQGAGRAGTIGAQDAERLLDAMRARERNMPLQAAPRKDARRRDVERDW